MIVRFSEKYCDWELFVKIMETLKEQYFTGTVYFSTDGMYTGEINVLIVSTNKSCKKNLTKQQINAEKATGKLLGS